jgi:hypothetical protein
MKHMCRPPRIWPWTRHKHFWICHRCHSVWIRDIPPDEQEQLEQAIRRILGEDD